MPGHAGEIALHALGVLRAAAGRADRRAHHQRDLDRAAGHVPQLGGVVDDLVHRQKQEIAVLDVDDRPHAHDGRADGRAEEAELGDRRVQHPVGKFLLEPERDGERAAPAARDGDVLAQAEDRRIAPHFLGDSFTERFGDAQSFHVVVLLGPSIG